MVILGDVKVGYILKINNSDKEKRNYFFSFKYIYSASWKLLWTNCGIYVPQIVSVSSIVSLNGM